MYRLYLKKEIKKIQVTISVLVLPLGFVMSLSSFCFVDHLKENKLIHDSQHGFMILLSPLDVELIWQAPSVECAVPVYRLTASKGLTFIKKWEWWTYNIFAFLCIFDGFSNFWGCFFVASINNKNPKILRKRSPVATTVPSGTQRHPWGTGIQGYTFGSSIQARAIPSPSWGSAPPVTTGSL